MSIKRMTAVWEYSQHKGSALLLMLAIADNANEETGLAWPGHAYLARKTRMSRRQVIRLIEACDKSGELWTLNRAEQKTNLYIVTVGLTETDVKAAAQTAEKMGIVTTIPSDNLTLPPQVLAVIQRPLVKIASVRMPLPSDKSEPGSDNLSPRCDIAMSHDPSSTVIEPDDKDDDDPRLDALLSYGVKRNVALDLAESLTMPEIEEGMIKVDKRGRRVKDKPAYLVSILRPDAPRPTNGNRRRVRAKQADSTDSRRFVEGEFAEYIEH